MADQLIRVLLADDDALVRSGLSLMLGGSPDLTIVGEATNGQEAIDRLTEVDVDVVLMDIRMPVLDGLEATTRILAKPNAPRIIILTTFDADEYVVRALAAGATGFLLKDTPPADIVDAIIKVAGGEPMLSPTITTQLIRQVTESATDARQNEATDRVALLTERELEVAQAIGRGASNAEIAQELFMSVATVKAHISHLFDKLNASNRVQVAITIHDAGLL